MKLISVIDPSRITPYLRQCKVLSPDDEEQVLNDPSLVMRKRKAGGSTSNTFCVISRPLVLGLSGELGIGRTAQGGGGVTLPGGV